MRRLYSTFAGGWPGIGLLLMRLVLGSVVIVEAGRPLWDHQPFQPTLASSIATGLGLLLMVGLWSPLAGTVVAIIELARILTVAHDGLTALLIATMSGALAMLGPGRWSVDARLFGWKRIDASPRKPAFIPPDDAPPGPPQF